MLAKEGPYIHIERWKHLYSVMSSSTIALQKMLFPLTLNINFLLRLTLRQVLTQQCGYF